MAQENKSELFLVWMLTTWLHESSGSQLQVITDIQHFANFTHCLNQSNHKGYYNHVFFVIWFFISQFRLVYSHSKLI